MTALAGIWTFGRQIDVAQATLAMIAAQELGKANHVAVETLNGAALGRGLFRILPEDEQDQGPWIHEGAWGLVADLRLDNREELLLELNCPVGTGMSDAELLFRAYARWGNAVVDHLVGDFAFVVWDSRTGTLTLVRDPVGQRPLHYHVGGGFVACASMASGLHALPEVPREVNQQHLAEFVADLPRRGTETYFEGISRVEPGQIVEISANRVESRFYWQLPQNEIHYPKDSDYVEAFREQLDRATRARLRVARGAIGAQLSAGLDSGGVAATAARLLAQTCSDLFAYTSAPRRGFSGPLPPGRIADESCLAAVVAARYPNMHHVIVRSDRSSTLDMLKRDGSLYAEPIGLPTNQLWWAAILDSAKASDVSVMLTGEYGNMTTSAGTIGQLAELVGAGQIGAWAKELRANRTAGTSWRGLLSASFGPYLPTWLWSLAARFLNGRDGAEGAALLRPQVRGALTAQGRNDLRGGRPGKIEKLERWDLLRNADPGNFRKAVLFRWGIDERDPTSDTRLAEFCFALPAEQLLRNGVTRRLARLGLADRLPPVVLNAPRGYQSADWYETLNPEQIRSELVPLRSSPIGTILDFDALENRLQSWPRDGWASYRVIATYRIALMRALSAAYFASQRIAE